MKAKNVLIVFAILMVAAMFSGCQDANVAGPTDPSDITGPDLTPKSQSVKVEYSRVLPVPYPLPGDAVTLVWAFSPYQGEAKDMPKVAEDSFVVNDVSIMTETRIRMSVGDPKMWNGSSLQVCRYLKIDGQELVVNYTYGELTFVYGNDGKVRVVN